ncbi:5-bromo-4-chloroindolyl phosphate hydrolysis family protein [Jannaschia seohaensis]|uniref:5-bromo-4-chloroindolyl phosphate hydrolysis protein n=1 Tax=Jannaschia seohaensis TaxID=475081 RepID=A0A2Y9ARW0_9RHOB|nr:5-bromo-4-chloroindolyl phosphate hydrolysis family protein [Jannaschia seohaensis]PWJ18301.1 5-bromo-4-chloroindolyl phosphate hydrolysis protein [Jannaschia seohaensis]SSA46826.1 5-bromo-4-chloroindolyl phosphate hydrolysis protein [Jannaschia seohaensis]
MAQRYEGRFSPGADGKTAVSPPPPMSSPLPGRARTSVLMVLAALPAITAFFQDGAVALAGNLAAAAALFGGAWLTREGMKAEAAWAARKIARRPAVPRKILGAVLTGAGVALATMTGLSGLIAGIVYGGVAAALHLASFGLDPLSDKGMEGIDTYQTNRVARSIEEAEKYLAAMQDAVRRAKDREAEARVARVVARARQMFRTVEEDPRDLSAARKFLGVYLMGARDATAKFADLYAQTRDATAKREYFALLDDLERGMDAKRETLLITDRTDLDVEIEVLRDRLKRDGLPVGE